VQAIGVEDGHVRDEAGDVADRGPANQTGYEPSPQPLSKAMRFAPDFSSVSSAATSPTSLSTNSSARGARAAAEDAS
jgi:hypothetical protein